MPLRWLMSWGMGCLALLVSIGCRAVTVGAEPLPAPATGPVTVPKTGDYVPVQTALRVRLDQPIHAEISQPGDWFTATVLDPVVAENGDVAIPRGAMVLGRVARLDPSDHLGDQASVELLFESIAFEGRAFPFEAAIVRTEVDAKRLHPDVATGAGLGALGGLALGAILGGASGALKGGLFGAAGGTIVSLGVGDVQPELPADTTMILRVTAPLVLEEDEEEAPREREPAPGLIQTRLVPVRT